MTQDSFIAEIVTKLKQYESQLERLNEQIGKLTSQRDALLQGYNAYRKILEIENHDIEGKDQAESKALPFEGVPNYAELSIPAAAEAVLRDSRRPLSNADLVREIRRRGKSMEGPNIYNVLYSSLKRKPDMFKKQGSLWTLTNKNPDTRAA